ncbi:GNAT family N-acetyltransferase [Nocardioides sp. Iso805N]|uniref:GNAT family N-acetyltransferase n=1 Tax=Nocardioides sp. Iso805N TaxID=1283287 RepID=UPI00038127E0|nr:GNAT family N-acetyltransferase [Nocardioides sp. Iso805N]
MSDVEVRNNPAENRYEAWLDGELAGIAVYGLGPSTVVFLHTEVEDKFGGQGVGGALAKGALDDVRADGRHDVIPLCPFIKSYIEKHPEYEDLVHRR